MFRILPKEKAMYSKTYVIPMRPIRWMHPGKNGKNYYDQQGKEKTAVGLYILKEHGKDRPFQGPLKITCTFYMETPKLLRNRHPSGFHCSAPDVTNLTKFLEDAIGRTGVVWTDDRQVAWQENKKIYDKNPRIEITIEELS